MVFLGGCTQKNPPGFFGYVPGCLNPGLLVAVMEISDLYKSKDQLKTAFKLFETNSKVFEAKTETD